MAAAFNGRRFIFISAARKLDPVFGAKIFAVKP